MKAEKVKRSLNIAARYSEAKRRIKKAKMLGKEGVTCGKGEI